MTEHKPMFNPDRRRTFCHENEINRKHCQEVHWPKIGNSPKFNIKSCDEWKINMFLLFVNGTYDSHF